MTREPGFLDGDERLKRLSFSRRAEEAWVRWAQDQRRREECEVRNGTDMNRGAKCTTDLVVRCRFEGGAKVHRSL
jgi:hypothetical protein